LRKITARKPSHFGSKLHPPALEGISSTRLASMGEIGDGKGGGTINWMLSAGSTDGYGARELTL
jgi:hypothetical protein